MSDDDRRPSAGRRRTGGRLAQESATALVLMPVAVLIVLLLGAMAFDLALAFAGERRVADLAAAWANDAASAIDPLQFYGDDATGGGMLAIDEDRARALVTDRFERLNETGVHLSPPQVELIDGQTIAVTVSGTIPLLFLDVVPGLSVRSVESTSIVNLVRVD